MQRNVILVQIILKEAEEQNLNVELVLKNELLLEFNSINVNKTFVLLTSSNSCKLYDTQRESFTNSIKLTYVQKQFPFYLRTIDFKF